MNHWHDPIPDFCNPIQLDEWWLLEVELNAPEFAENAAQTIQEWWFYVRMHPKTGARAVREDMA